MVGRLWSCLIVLRLFLSFVRLVGLVKCLLNELAMSLFGGDGMVIEFD